MGRVARTAGFFGHLARDLVGTLVGRFRRWYRRMVVGEEIVTVGVDIFPFYERMTGVGWYEWNVLAQLPRVDEAVRLNFYAHTFAAPDEPSPPPMPGGSRCRFRFHHIPEEFLLPIRPTIQVLRAVLEPVLLFLDGNDLFFAPNFFVPRRHLAAAARHVATVHDLAFLRFPETLQAETLDNLRRFLPRAVVAADALVAVSQATAEDLATLVGVTPRRIHVIHEGVDPVFLGASRPPRVTLPRRYLLFVSTLEPRKNIVGLLAGFAAAAASGYDGDLVLVGRWGWKTEAAQAELAASPVRHRIHHLDYLEREELVAVLRGAEAVVFPSLLEGFGLPVVEAMAAGVPVITSNVSSLPEVGGEAVLYVDPRHPAELAAAICRLAADGELRQRLVEAGRRRAERFRWEEAARATAGVFRRVAALPERFPDAYCV